MFLLLNFLVAFKWKRKREYSLVETETDINIQLYWK